MVRTEVRTRPARRLLMTTITAFTAVALVALAVVSLQTKTSPVVEDLYFNKRALEEQVDQSTPAIPGDYFDPRNLKETDPATVSGAGSVYGRPPELEQEGEPEQTSQLEQEPTAAQTSELEQDGLEGAPEGDSLAEGDEEGPEQLETDSQPKAPTSELAMEDPAHHHSNLRKEVSKLAEGQSAIQKELKTLETVLIKNAKQGQQLQAAPAPPVSLEEDEEPHVHSGLPQLALDKSTTTDDAETQLAPPSQAHSDEHSKSGQLRYGQKILIRTHHGHFVASKPSGSVLTLSHKHAAAQFTILNYDDPTDKSPVRFGDVVGLQDGSHNYLSGDVDGRLEASKKSLSRQDAFVLTDPHNHDDVAHVKNTQPISLFSVHFGKFMAVDGDEELMVHGDSDNSNAQFAMLAQ